jgi:hypothetical protein
VRHIDAAVLIFAFAIVPPSEAAQLEVRIGQGRVSIVAEDATVGEILEAWAQIGETRIVNGDRVPGGRVTLHLDNLSEQEALDILLQKAAGFIAVPRSAPVETQSRYDRILILPTSSAPPAPRPAARAPVFLPPQSEAPVAVPPEGAPVIGPDGRPLADDRGAAPDPARPLPPYQTGTSPPVDYVPVPVAPAGDQPDAPDADAAPGAPDAPGAPVTPTAAPAVGAPVPGMVVPAPRPERTPIQR